MLQSIKKYPCFDYDNCLKIKTLSPLASPKVGCASTMLKKIGIFLGIVFGLHYRWLRRR